MTILTWVFHVTFSIFIASSNVYCHEVDYATPALSQAGPWPDTTTRGISGQRDTGWTTAASGALGSADSGADNSFQPQRHTTTATTQVKIKPLLIDPVKRTKSSVPGMETLQWTTKGAPEVKKSFSKIFNTERSRFSGANDTGKELTSDDGRQLKKQTADLAGRDESDLSRPSPGDSQSFLVEVSTHVTEKQEEYLPRVSSGFVVCAGIIVVISITVLFVLMGHLNIHHSLTRRMNNKSIETGQEKQMTLKTGGKGGKGDKKKKKKKGGKKQKGGKKGGKKSPKRKKSKTSGKKKTKRKKSEGEKKKKGEKSEGEESTSSEKSEGEKEKKGEKSEGEESTSSEKSEGEESTSSEKSKGEESTSSEKKTRSAPEIQRGPEDEPARHKRGARRQEQSCIKRVCKCCIFTCKLCQKKCTCCQRVEYMEPDLKKAEPPPPLPPPPPPPLPPEPEPTVEVSPSSSSESTVVIYVLVPHDDEDDDDLLMRGPHMV